MMPRRSPAAVSRRRALVSAATLLLMCIPLGSAMAADHNDSPATTADPTADITDVYAWMTEDAGNLVLALNIPAESFSDAVQYVFHVESKTSLLMPGTVTDVICTFDAAQAVSCWVGDQDFVTGDASAEAGLVSDSAMVKVFAGLRDDPFFFNLTGFQTAVETIKTAAPTLTFDAANCPTLDEATSTLLVGQLSTGGNDFAASNVSALVLEIDKSLVTPGGDVVSVWASTRTAP